MEIEPIRKAKLGLLKNSEKRNQEPTNTNPNSHSNTNSHSHSNQRTEEEASSKPANAKNTENQQTPDKANNLKRKDTLEKCNTPEIHSFPPNEATLNFKTNQTSKTSKNEGIYLFASFNNFLPIKMSPDPLATNIYQCVDFIQPGIHYFYFIKDNQYFCVIFYVFFLFILV
jgi:hypothetical protein